MNEVRLAWTWMMLQAGVLRDRARARTQDQTGAGIVETVIIIAAFAAAAIVIVGILVTKARTAANNVQTQ
jgi:hypothetical protein